MVTNSSDAKEVTKEVVKEVIKEVAKEVIKAVTVVICYVLLPGGYIMRLDTVSTCTFL